MTEWSVEVARVLEKDGQYRPDTVVLDVIVDDEQVRDILKAIGTAIAMKATAP